MIQIDRIGHTALNTNEDILRVAREKHDWSRLSGRLNDGERGGLHIIKTKRIIQYVAMDMAIVLLLLHFFGFAFYISYEIQNTTCK